MTEKIYSDRQQQLKNVIADSGLDGILITNLTNIRYICGFTGSAGTCLVTPSGQYFITDGRYIEQSKEQVKGFDRFIDMDTNLSIIKKNELLNNDTKIGFEGDHVNFTLYDSMKKMFTGINWESTKMILEDLASVKDETELDAIRTAVDITDRVYEEILPMLRPGYTERQVANTLVSKYREYGDGEAYSPIVATGPNGALPHAVPTDREFKKGDFIVIDAAAKYAGYHADMTRTPVVGQATDKHHEIYTHGTGHGLGLEIHTSPRFSPASEDVLAENNVMTIEPGIYLAGWGGVRIEDDVIINKDDCEILNKTTKDLVVLD